MTTGKKICSKCGKLLLLRAFGIRGDKTGLKSMCCECVKVYDREYYHAGGNERRKTKRDHSKAIYSRNKAFVRDLLNSRCCNACGETDHIVLEFHHRPDESKLNNVTDMMSLSIETIETEIAKCDILCANCHRRLHYYKRIEE